MSAAKNTAIKAVTLAHPVNKKVTAEMTAVSPATAEKWLGQNHGNRNLRSRKVANYARDMRNGKWQTTGDSIKFDYNGRLIDGQHRLEAVIDSGATIIVLVVRGLDPDVQGVLDTNVKRTPADALKFDGHEYNNTVLSGMARIANARALGYLKTSTATTIPEMTNSEIVQWVVDNPEADDAAALARRTGKTIGATPSALAYAIWVLERIDGVAAVEFFTSTAEFRTNGATDPRATLLRTFNRMKEQRATLTPAVQLRIIFAAWNAWRSNKSLAKMPITNSAASGVGGVQIPEPK